MIVDRPPPPPKPKKPAEPKPAAKPVREQRSSSFQTKKAAPQRRESKSTSFQTRGKPTVALTATAPLRAKTPAAALDNVQSAKSSFDGAKSKVDGLTARLGQEMQKLSPALSDAEKQKFVQAFHKKYEADFNAETAASRRLGNALTDPMLDKAVEQTPAAAYDVGDAAESLAQSSHAADALRWVAHAFSPSNPASAEYKAIAQPLTVAGPRGMRLEQHGAIDVENDIVAPAAENAPGQLMAENTNAQSALQSYKQLLSNVHAVGYGGKEMKSGMALLDTVQTALDKGNFTGLKAGAFIKVGTLGPLAKSMSSAGLAFSAFGIGNDIQQKNYAQLASDVTGAGSTGVGIVTGSLKGLNSAGEIAGLEGLRNMSFLDRLAPGIGVVSNAIAVGIDVNGLVHDPSVASAVSTVGDSIALAGSAVGVVLPGVGQIIQGAGMVVSAFGALLSGDAAKHALDDEEQTLLGQSGVSAPIAKTLAQSDDGVISRFAGLHMGASAIQSLAANAPETFGAPGDAQAVVDAANAIGLKGSDVPPFVAAMKKDDGNYLETLFVQLEGKQGDHDAAHDEQLRQVIAARFPTANAYAQAHAPQSFGAAADLRSRADRDLEVTGADPAAMTNLLKQNTQADYQAEIIKQLKDSGRLDFWTQQMGGRYHYNGWPEAAAQAVRAAQQRGVLSAADANKALATIG